MPLTQILGKRVHPIIPHMRDMHNSDRFFEHLAKNSSVFPHHRFGSCMRHNVAHAED